jgi:flagellar protein FliO/FliZ
MVEIMTWFAIIVFIAALVALGVLFVRGSLGNAGSVAGIFGGGNLFGAPRVKRLDVVEHTSLDGRRRLVLIRRDNIEHLIMTGGPVDVVIETNIGAPKVTERQERPRVAAVDAPSEQRLAFGRARAQQGADG